MTHIAPSRIKTKKQLKEAIAADPSRIYFDDPAIVGAVSGNAEEILRNRRSFVATNHPVRSWFAEISRNKAGQIVVK